MQKPVLIDSNGENPNEAQAVVMSHVQRERLSTRGSERIKQQSVLHGNEHAESSRNDCSLHASVSNKKACEQLLQIHNRQVGSADSSNRVFPSSSSLAEWCLNALNKIQGWACCGIEETASQKPVLIDSNGEIPNEAQAAMLNRVQRERLSTRGSERTKQQSVLHGNEHAEGDRNDRSNAQALVTISLPLCPQPGSAFLSRAFSGPRFNRQGKVAANAWGRIFPKHFDVEFLKVLVSV
jgi:hypothetical protein